MSNLSGLGHLGKMGKMGKAAPEERRIGEGQIPKSLAARGLRFSSTFPIVPNGSEWFPTVPNGSVWFRLVPHGSVWFPLVPLLPAGRQVVEVGRLRPRRLCPT